MGVGGVQLQKLPFQLLLSGPSFESAFECCGLFMYSDASVHSREVKAGFSPCFLRCLQFIGGLL